MLENNHMENDGFSDKSEREAHEDSDNAANENGGRVTEESDMDQSDDLSPCLQATTYVEQGQEEMGEVSWMRPTSRPVLLQSDQPWSLLLPQHNCSLLSVELA